MLKAAEGALDSLARVLLGFSNILLAALFLLINLEIVLRATIGKSTLVSDEYSGYLLCWLTLSGLLYGMRTDAFIRVDFAVQRLRGRSRHLAEAFAALGGLSVSLVACHATALLTITSWQFNSSSSHYVQTPLYLPQSIMPVAFGLLGIAYLVQLCVSLGKLGAATPAPRG